MLNNLEKKIVRKWRIFGYLKCFKYSKLLQKKERKTKTSKRRMKNKLEEKIVKKWRMMG
jgi:hypothetical protein